MKVSLKYQEKLFSVIVFKLISLSIQTFFVGRVGGGGIGAYLSISVFLANIWWLVFESGRIFEVGCLRSHINAVLYKVCVQLFHF